MADKLVDESLMGDALVGVAGEAGEEELLADGVSTGFKVLPSMGDEEPPGMRS